MIGDEEALVKLDKEPLIRTALLEETVGIIEAPEEGDVVCESKRGEFEDERAKEVDLLDEDPTLFVFELVFRTEFVSVFVIESVRVFVIEFVSVFVTEFVSVFVTEFVSVFVTEFVSVFVFVIDGVIVRLLLLELLLELLSVLLFVLLFVVLIDGGLQYLSTLALVVSEIKYELVVIESKTQLSGSPVKVVASIGDLAVFVIKSG